MIPSVTPPLTSTTSPTDPPPQGATTSPATAPASAQEAAAQAPSLPPLLQSSVVPAHNIAGFLFKISDTETGRVIVELPFLADPNAGAGENSGRVDVRV